MSSCVSPHDTAARVAHAAATAAARGDQSGRLDLAISVVGAVSLIRRGPHDTDPAGALRTLDAPALCEVLDGVYRTFIRTRPDLTHAIHPVAQWLAEPTRHQQQTAHAITRAALDAGLIDLAEHHHEVDVLGNVLTALTSGIASQAAAKIYTPATVADAIAALNPPTEHSTVLEPAVGTGGILRAAAHAMRRLGRDPATVAWYGADVDESAIAACAINAWLWDLGPVVLLCTANVLAEPDWHQRADAMRREQLDLARTGTRLRLVQHLTRPDGTPSGQSGEPRPGT